MDSRVNPNKTYQHRPEATNRPQGIASDYHDDPLMRNTLRKSHSLSRPDAVGKSLPTSQASPHASYQYAGSENFQGSIYLRSNAAYGAVGGDSLTCSSNGGRPGSESGGSADALRETRPGWVGVGDPGALRFLGYFREAIHESNDETTRIRKIGLVFHTSDASIAIREARQPNSGIVQGLLLQRQKVPRNPVTQSPDSTYTVDDLNIGAALNIFGTVYHLVDMDESTRKHLRSIGKTVSDQALPWPVAEDVYNATVARQFAVKPVKKMTTGDMDQKRVMEQLLTGIITKHSSDEIATSQQFHANKINEHLQFAALWDDRGRIGGDARLCVIRYFLENDTVEVLEARQDNCGREGSAKLLVRQRVAVEGVDPLLAKSQQNTYGVVLRKDFLTAKDFAIGKTFHIHNVCFVIYDADEFTRRHFEEKVGRPLGPAVDITDVLRKGAIVPPTHVPPPHDGYGTEEDSLSNWKHLMLKAPKQDPIKAEKEDGKVLTFSAKLHGTAVAPEEVKREFVIKFYRATDEVEIFECQGQNSGFVGGKFLTKARHMKTLTSGRKVPFMPSDFQVGVPVVICAREYMLTGIDKRSERIVAGIPTLVTEDRIRELILMFKNLLITKFVRLNEAYRIIAPDGAITIREIRETFAKSTCSITEEESMYLINYFAPDGNGLVSFERFVTLMDIPNSQSMDITSIHPRSIQNISMRLDETLKNATLDAVDALLVKNTRRMLVDKIVKRRGTLQEAFLLLGGHSATAKLGKASFQAAMIDVLHMNVTDKEKAIVMELVFPRGKLELSLRDFHDFIESDY